MTKEELKNRVLNGGRGSGQSLRVLIEVYENKIVDLEQKNKDLADCNSRLLSQAAAATKRVVALEKENAELKEQLEKETNHRIQNFNKAIEWKEKHRKLEKENLVLHEMNKKRLDLQKENAELKSVAEFQQSSNMKRHFEIQKLKKENAELKEYNKYLKRKRQGGIQKQYNKVAIIKQQNDQLTKAKELIKGLLDLPDLIEDRTSEHTELIGRAEQFLEEEI